MRLLAALLAFCVTQGASAITIVPDCNDWTFAKEADGLAFYCPGSDKHWLKFGGCLSVRAYRNTTTLRTRFVCNEGVCKGLEVTVLPRKV